MPIGTLKASIDAKSVSTLKARLPANWASKSTKELLKFGLDNLRQLEDAKFELDNLTT